MAVAFVLGTLLFLDAAGPAFSNLRVWITSRFDWLFMIGSNIFVVFCLFIAYSKLGRVRFGGPDAKPRYGYPGWLAMLFAAGVGIGLMFFGVLEPVTHTLNPPLGIDPADTETAMAAGMSSAILHWGLHAWAVYAVVGLALAFFCFNRGLPLTMRSAFFPLFGKAVWGPFGHVVDITAVLATLFGLATSLGLGAQHDVFERARTETREARVHAGRIVLEYRDLLRGRRCDDGAGAGAETMKAVALVGIHRGLAEQLRQLTRRLAPDQVHLEKAVLPVGEPGRVGQVGPRSCRDDRNAGVVALNGRGVPQSRRRKFAVELRQAGPQGEP